MCVEDYVVPIVLSGVPSPPLACSSTGLAEGPLGELGAPLLRAVLCVELYRVDHCGGAGPAAGPAAGLGLCARPGLWRHPGPQLQLGQLARCEGGARRGLLPKPASRGQRTAAAGRPVSAVFVFVSSGRSLLRRNFKNCRASLSV